MKDLRFLVGMLVMMMTITFSACSDDENPAPIPDPDPSENSYHFDIWIAVDKHGGMGRDVKTLVRSVSSLEADQPIIDFVGEGTEVNSKLTLENIIKGAYYYQVPVSGDRFGKYTLSDNQINIIQEQKFKNNGNTYSPRKYTHAWIPDNKLIIMAANGDGTEIIYTLLDASSMEILKEGTLDIQVPTGSASFTTSGILTYREKDNKLIYFYYGKAKKGALNSTASKVFTAVINASTMAVESSMQTTKIDEMVGSAYGELLQKCVAFDESGNLYLASLSNDADKVERSHLLKIKAGEKDFDPDYDGFKTDGKLLSIEYLGNNKVLAYAREDELGTSIDSYSHYYAIIDLTNKSYTRLSYNGTDLPYSSGRFSQRTAIAGGKAYIGVNPKDSNPCIYIYDIATGTVTKGREIAEGYYFEQIRVLEDEQ